MTKYNCVFGGFLETRIRDGNFEAVKKRLESFWTVESNTSFSKNCRILLVWDSDLISVTVLEKHEQYIHCQVMTKDLKWKGLITVVYGLNLAALRIVLWKDLAEYSTKVNLP